MHREIIHSLLDWKSQKKRKPLIVNGARQVGKSWIVEQFGERNYDGDVHIINFEKKRIFHTVFELDFDVQRIIMELELILGKSIDSRRDLVFFDEIQASPLALASLRYFYEDMPELHLIAAGSLLDFEFRNIPYPVGRVQSLNMYPMTFYEFLVARGKERLAELLKSPETSMSETVINLIEKELQNYMIVGGMPECVADFVEQQNFLRIRQIQDDLLYSFNQDFKKYHPSVDKNCLADILLNTTKAVGNQIIYSRLSDRFSHNTIRKGIEVLTKARVLTKVPNVSIAGLPLAPTGKRFKLFYLDIGLLIRASNYNYEETLFSNKLIAGYKGALAEQFVAQELIAAQSGNLHYWSRTKPGSSAEVDFVIVRNGETIPVEVKAGKTGSLKSMHLLLAADNPIKKGFVLSLSRKGTNNNVIFIPIYYAGFI